MALDEDGLEMVHVFRQRDEGMFVVDTAAAPGLGLGLKRAHHQLARVFLVIGAFIGHAHHRHVARQIRDGLGDDVEMLAGMERNVDADATAQFARPHAGRNHHLVGHDCAIRRFNAKGLAFLNQDTRDFRVLKNLAAARPRARRQRLRHIDRIDLAVLGQEHAAFDAFHVVVRHALLDLGRADDINCEAKTLGHGGAAQQFLHAPVGERDRDRAILLEAGGLSRFLLQPLEKAGGVFRQLGQIPGGAQLPDKARRMPGCAGGELLALQYYRIGDADLAQMIGDRRSDNAPANNNDIATGGQGLRHEGKLQLGVVNSSNIARSGTESARRVHVDAPELTRATQGA